MPRKKLNKIDPFKLFNQKRPFIRPTVIKKTKDVPPAQDPDAPKPITINHKKIYWTWPQKYLDEPNIPMYDLTGREIKEGDFVARINGYGDKPHMKLAYIVEVNHGHLAMLNFDSDRVCFTPVSKYCLIVTDSKSVQEVFTQIPITLINGKKKYKARKKKSLKVPRGAARVTK